MMQRQAGVNGDGELVSASLIFTQSCGSQRGSVFQRIFTGWADIMPGG